MKLDVHLNLDDAWPEGVLGLPAVDARVWGPRLRYFAPERLLAEFHQAVLTPLPPFVPPLAISVAKPAVESGGTSYFRQTRQSARRRY